MGREQSLQQMLLRQLDSHVEKSDILLLYIKFYWKWIKTIHVKTKIIKLLDQNHGGESYDLGFDNGFLDMTLKVEGKNRTKNPP